MGSVKVTHKVVQFSVAYFFGGSSSKAKTGGSRTTRKRR
jgi:hypothetical protein